MLCAKDVSAPFEPLTIDEFAVICSENSSYYHGKINEGYYADIAPSAVPSSFLNRGVIEPFCPFSKDFIGGLGQDFHQGIKESCPDLCAEPSNLNVLLVNGRMLVYRAESRGEEHDAKAEKRYSNWERKALGSAPKGVNIYNYETLIINDPDYENYLSEILDKINKTGKDSYAEVFHQTVGVYLYAALAKTNPELFNGRECSLSRNDPRYRGSMKYIASELAALHVLQKMFAYYAHPHTSFEGIQMLEYEAIQANNPGNLAPLFIARKANVTSMRRRRNSGEEFGTNYSQDVVDTLKTVGSYASDVYETALSGCDIPTIECVTGLKSEAIVRKRVDHMTRMTSALLHYASSQISLFHQVIFVMTMLRQAYDPYVSTGEVVELETTAAPKPLVSHVFTDLSIQTKVKKVTLIQCDGDPMLNDYLRHYCLALVVCDHPETRSTLLKAIDAAFTSYLGALTKVGASVSNAADGGDVIRLSLGS